MSIHVTWQNHSTIAKFKILKGLKGKKKIRNYLPLVNLQQQRCSMEKGVLRDFTKFTEKHMCQSLRPGTLLNKRLWHRCFTVNFTKYLRTPLDNCFWIDHWDADFQKQPLTRGGSSPSDWVRRVFYLVQTLGE